VGEPANIFRHLSNYSTAFMSSINLSLNLIEVIIYLKYTCSSL
jgi:hypothetical protein